MLTRLTTLFWFYDQFDDCKLIWECEETLSMEACTRLKKIKKRDRRNFQATDSKLVSGFCLRIKLNIFISSLTINFSSHAFCFLHMLTFSQLPLCEAWVAFNSFERDQIYFNSRGDNMRFAFQSSEWLTAFSCFNKSVLSLRGARRKEDNEVVIYNYLRDKLEDFARAFC